MSKKPYSSPAASPDPSSKETGPRRGSLLVIFLTVFIDLLGFGIVLPLLPIYAREFLQLGPGTPAATASASEAAAGLPAGSGLTFGLLMASFSIMQFLFAPLWGRLSDRIGRRPVLLIGLAGSVVFYGLFAVASVWKSLPLLFLARIGAGVAGATISTAHAYIADTTTSQTRAKGMALVGAAFGLGFTFGPLVALVAMWGSEEIGPGPGIAAAALSLVAFVLAIFKLPESLGAETTEAHAGLRRTWLDTRALREALATPSIMPLLLTTFVCVVAFASFESTLSLLLKNETTGFNLDYQHVALSFAYIGLVLAIVQGGIVRRLSGRLSETTLAVTGALVMIAGLTLLGLSQQQPHAMWMLYVALAVCVGGFAFITPSLNSLISRRSHPSRQGGILGLAQSVSSLGRICGPVIGLRLFEHNVRWPLYTGVGLLVLATVMIVWAGARGKDYAVAA